MGCSDTSLYAVLLELEMDVRILSFGNKRTRSI
jgi:hypothetical protein